MSAEIIDCLLAILNGDEWIFDTSGPKSHGHKKDVVAVVLRVKDGNKTRAACLCHLHRCSS